MLTPFFALAAQSPTRQRTFRRAVVVHLALLAGAAWAMYQQPRSSAATLLGHVLLVAGIVEGAALVGWRLTQLPKSQALEFLLVSPLRPARLLIAEALVGAAQLGLVGLAGLPVLGLLVVAGLLDPLDPAPLLLVPWTWGTLTGLGLTVWAYEPLRVRRWGERLAAALVVLYLVVGVLAGENLRRWLEFLPSDVGLALLRGFAAFHTHNPFGVMRFWLEGDLRVTWERMAGLELAGALVVLLLLMRAARRLQSHFHELHYQPAVDTGRALRPRVGERPLTWWAVKRVTRYSGRINLWLAGGFGLLYALHTVAGEHWPAWMGQRVFQMCDAVGGIAGLAACLVVLAAVPAAFQYGLWDSSTQDRCRRLELLLLTRLQPSDYWDAAARAAWQRGRGYFAVALLLWGAALFGGRIPLPQVIAALATAVLLWALYFALGFRAFSRGLQANGLGTLLTVGLPLLAFGLAHLDWPTTSTLLPPGAVYRAAAEPASFAWLAAPVLIAALTLTVARRALRHCDADLRDWYDRHHGHKMLS
jgi:hypothetical protein